MDKIIYKGQTINLEQAAEENLLPGQTVYTGETASGVTPRAKFRLLVGPTRLKRNGKRTLIQLRAFIDVDTTAGIKVREITVQDTLINEDSPDGIEDAIALNFALLTGILADGGKEMVRRVKRNAIGVTVLDAAKISAITTAVGTIAS
jgi:hypothetical protein